MFIHNAICPVSNVKIDSNVSRLTVFLNSVLLAAYLLTGAPYFVGLVAIDYAIRAIWNVNYSPLRFIAKRIITMLAISEKRIDQAPKLFASRVGFLFALTSLLLFPANSAASLIVAGVLLVFTILDSVVDFCVGCITYSYIVLPFYQFIGIRKSA